MLRFVSRFIERRPLLMAVGEAVGMGLQGIRAYKMRAFLTILGVVMGIMTVTGMSSIVAGLNASMAKQIATLGSSTIFIRPQAPGENVDDDEWRRRKGLTMDEVDLIAARPAVKAIAPLQFIPIENVKYGTEQAREAQVLGTTAAYEEVHDSYVEKGRFLSGTDVERAAHVVVLGVDIADALFPVVDPVDKVISLDGRPFTVIGVLQRKGRFLFRSMDNIVLVPVNSIQKQDRRFNFMMADIKPISPGHIEDAVDETRETMRRYRKLKYMQKDNFGIFGQDTLTDLYRQITGGIYMVMIAISSIGLLVGGVGVMNIMLVSVTERTREIGVRKALGATRRDILWQFLTEAMTLTGTGGVIGILIGAVAAFLINTFSPFPAVIQPTWVILAFSTSMAVGLTFGLWPAAKAARLDPIEALRYE
jgi:putative ABC transport system permease protein